MATAGDFRFSTCNCTLPYEQCCGLQTVYIPFSQWDATWIMPETTTTVSSPRIKPRGYSRRRKILELRHARYEQWRKGWPM